MGQALRKSELEVVLFEDHVRLMDEACASLSEHEIRELIAEIAEEVQNFHSAKSQLVSQESSFDSRQFIAISLAEAYQSL